MQAVPVDVAGLPVLTQCAAAWQDVDQDGDPDLALSGADATGQPLSRVFLYSGGAPLFVDSGMTVAQVTDGGLAWGDYDNDGDADLALCGMGAQGPYTALYAAEARRPGGYGTGSAPVSSSALPGGYRTMT